MNAIIKEKQAIILKRFSLSFKLNHSIIAMRRNVNDKATDATKGFKPVTNR